MLVGPVEAQHRTPVLQYQCHVVAEIQGVPQREQVVALFGVVVAAWTRRVQLVRSAHPDQIAGHQPAQPLQVWHHVAPQIRRRRVAVRKDDRVALALVDVGHPLAVDVAVSQLPVGFCRNHDGASLVVSSGSVSVL